MQYFCVIYLYKSPSGLLIRSYKENWLWGDVVGRVSYWLHDQKNIRLCDAKQVYHYKNIKQTTLTDYQIHIKTGRNMWFL